MSLPFRAVWIDFYPRSPCGERPVAAHVGRRKLKFLSTLSLRRATARRALGFVDPDISIHALLAESDRALATYWTRTAYFYPRSPCGERHLALIHWTVNIHFYPRSPCGERLGVLASDFKYLGISIHALLAESDIITAVFVMRNFNFYPRSPCGERPR